MVDTVPNSIMSTLSHTSVSIKVSLAADVGDFHL